MMTEFNFIAILHGEATPTSRQLLLETAYQIAALAHNWIDPI